MLNMLIRGALALAVTSCVVDVEASGGDTTTIKVTDADTIYCDGAMDCPPHPECGTWWCHQIQRDDDDYGVAWGRCNLAPVVNGFVCGDGSGRCDDRVCKPVH